MSILSVLKSYFGYKESQVMLDESNISEALSHLTEDRFVLLLEIMTFLPPLSTSDGFGLWVRASRKKLELSQAELALWISSERDRVCKLEKRTTNLPKEKADIIRQELISRLKQKGFL